MEAARRGRPWTRHNCAAACSSNVAATQVWAAPFAPNPIHYQLGRGAFRCREKVDRKDYWTKRK